MCTSFTSAQPTGTVLLQLDVHDDFLGLHPYEQLDHGRPVRSDMSRNLAADKGGPQDVTSTPSL